MLEFGLVMLTCDKCSATALTGGAQDCYSDCPGYLCVLAGWTVDGVTYAAEETLDSYDMPDADVKTYCPACKP